MLSFPRVASVTPIPRTVISTLLIESSWSGSVAVPETVRHPELAETASVMLTSGLVFGMSPTRTISEYCVDAPESSVATIEKEYASSLSDSKDTEKLPLAPSTIGVLCAKSV